MLTIRKNNIIDFMGNKILDKVVESRDKIKITVVSCNIDMTESETAKTHQIWKKNTKSQRGWYIITVRDIVS